MKKLIHPGIFAIIAMIAITVSSCTKSANDLVIGQKESKKEPASANKGADQTALPGTDDGGSTIFPLINEPIRLKLGDPDNNVAPGSVAVFYVQLSDAFAKDPASSATLTTMDYNDGGAIQDYHLISSDEADAYGVRVPDELVGKPFMFAIVELDDQYTDRTISLHSSITVNELTTENQLDHVFTISYFVNGR